LTAKINSIITRRVVFVFVCVFLRVLNISAKVVLSDTKELILSVVVSIMKTPCHVVFKILLLNLELMPVQALLKSIFFLAHPF
jgi:hypothetical protein